MLQRTPENFELCGWSERDAAQPSFVVVNQSTREEPTTHPQHEFKPRSDSAMADILTAVGV